MIVSEQMTRFLARLGVTPLDEDNELHVRLVGALSTTGHEPHYERLLVTRGVLSAAYGDLSIVMGAARAKYEKSLKSQRAQYVRGGLSVSAATAIAEGDAQDLRTGFLEAEALWRGVRELLRTVDADIDKTRSGQVDARHMNDAASRGVGA